MTQSDKKEPAEWRYWPLKELYLTRLREFYRQPARIFWVYGFPLIMAVGLSLAFRNQEPQPIAVTVADGPGAEPVIAALSAPEAAKGRPGRPGLKFDREPIDRALFRLRTGQTPLVVEPRTDGGVIYHYDPTRPEAGAARGAVDDVIQRARRPEGLRDPVPTAEAILNEPGSRYIDWLLPGLIGLNVMGGGLWGIGFLLVNFRIAKLLKRFVATPMPRHDFLLALLGARLTFLIPDAGILLGVGVFVFHMPIRGNLLLLAVILVVGALAFAGVGLLVASRARTTETVSGLMNLVMLPMWLLSGVFFSYTRFPRPVQYLSLSLPLTHTIDALRSVILLGAGPLEVLPSIAILSAWAVGTFALSLRIFRWQ